VCRDSYVASFEVFFCGGEVAREDRGGGVDELFL
jgi:hypothetical protein